jgi:hypothetical protein
MENSMAKLEQLGGGASIDCTSALPKANLKRSVKRAAIHGRKY